MSKSFAALLVHYLRFLRNYFDDLTKSFSDLYLTKFLIRYFSKTVLPNRSLCTSFFLKIYIIEYIFICGTFRNFYLQLEFVTHLILKNIII